VGGSRGSCGIVKPPLVELGGRGPVLALAVANGFPPDTYRPMLRPLADRFRAVALPPRALWPNAGPPPEQAGTWESMAEDLVDGLDAHGLHDVVAVGHSYGAVAWLIAATRYPGRISALVLLDPTIMSPSVMDRIAAERGGGDEARFTLVQLALKRRRRFDSPAEALEYWRTRPLFSDWPDESLRLYVDAMLRPAEDGLGFELRWTPEWEAWYYRSFYAGTWVEVAALTRGTPLLVLRGEATDTYLPDAAEEFARLAPWGLYRTVPGGHLFPQSHPETTGATLCDFLTSPPASV
jgi:pimeloyl-ACP methyl ester carboxylesterase